MNTRHTPANVRQEVLTRQMNDKFNKCIPAAGKPARKKALYMSLAWIIGLAAVLTTLGACGLISKY